MLWYGHYFNRKRPPIQSRHSGNGVVPGPQRPPFTYQKGTLSEVNHPDYLTLTSRLLWVSRVRESRAHGQTRGSRNSLLKNLHTAGPGNAIPVVCTVDPLHSFIGFCRVTANLKLKCKKIEFSSRDHVPSLGPINRHGRPRPSCRHAASPGYGYRGYHLWPPSPLLSSALPSQPFH